MGHAVKHHLTLAIFCACILFGTTHARAQNADATLPDNPSPATQPQQETVPSAEREVMWRALPDHFLQDQKGIWLFPTQLAKGHHWLPTLAVAGATAGLIVADPHIMP